MIGVLVKMIICRIAARVIMTCKSDEYVDIKSCSWQNFLIDKLVLAACMDKILNTTETSLDDKKATYEKSKSINHTISLIIISFLLLVAIFISCYYYRRDWIKKNTYYRIIIKSIV